MIKMKKLNQITKEKGELSLVESIDQWKKKLKKF